MNIDPAVMVAVVDADRVVERLERRARLAVAVADDVVLRLERLAALRGVVVGGADVRHELAGLVVERDERSVPESLVLEVPEPRAGTSRSRAPWPPPRGSWRCGTIAAAATHFSAIFWRRRSSVVVMRRPPCSSSGHVVASGPHRRSVSSSRTAQTKCGAVQRGVAWLARSTTSSLALRNLGRGVLAARLGSAALGQQVQHGVAPLDDRRPVGDHEVRLRALRVLGHDGLALLDGVAHEVVVRRRLRQAGDDRRLGRRDAPRAACRSSSRPRPSRRSSGCRSSSG